MDAGFPMYSCLPIIFHRFAHKTHCLYFVYFPGNWMAADTRAHLDYYINICKPYNPGGTSPSCSGPVGGCQVDRKNHKAHNMGFVRGSPYLSTSGDLALEYTGGEECHGVFHRSTRINFFCSKVHVSMNAISSIRTNNKNNKTTTTRTTKQQQHHHQQQQQENNNNNINNINNINNNVNNNINILHHQVNVIMQQKNSVQQKLFHSEEILKC